MTKVLLIVKNTEHARDAAEHVVDLIRHNPYKYDVDVLYVAPDCWQLYPQPGVCFWIPKEELQIKINEKKQLLTNIVTPVFNSINYVPRIITKSGEQDKIVKQYLTNGEYDLVIVAGTNKTTEEPPHRGHKAKNFGYTLTSFYRSCFA